MNNKILDTFESFLINSKQNKLQYTAVDRDQLGKIETF